MLCDTSQTQHSLTGIKTPFDVTFETANRCIKLSQGVPWDALAEGDDGRVSLTHGRPAKDARLVMGAAILKHKQCWRDEETVEQRRENPYRQYVVGLAA